MYGGVEWRRAVTGESTRNIDIWNKVNLCHMSLLLKREIKWNYNFFEIHCSK